MDSTELLTFSQVCSTFFDLIDRRVLISRILGTAIERTSGDRGTLFIAPEGQSGRNAPELASLLATGLEGREIRIDARKGIVGHVFTTGESLIIDDAQNDPRFYKEIDSNSRYRTQTILCVPLVTPTGRKIGAIELLNSKKGKFTDDDLKTLLVIARFAATALENRDTIDLLTDSNERLKQRQWTWLESVEKELIATANGDLREVYGQLGMLAGSGSSILIEGESGTGKDVMAQLLHFKSDRREKPFVAINCAAIPESLFEAELFGVAKGAATGTSARRGKIELAHGGSLFLDEIGELPLGMQAKLLRVLQERVVSRVGSEDRPTPVDFRLLVATNRDLEKLVQEGKFREDLYYRINVVRLRLPALRNRAEDIPLLCSSMIKRFSFDRGWKGKELSPAALDKLKAYSWPGNIRQLNNKIEGAMILSGDRMRLEPRDFQLEPKLEAVPRMEASQGASSSNEMPSNVIDLDLRSGKERFERELIKRALEAAGGNKSEAARKLGISREGLRKAMMKLAV
jgi:Nif-specific regulatory protein